MLNEVLERIEHMLTDEPNAKISDSLQIIRQTFELYGIEHVGFSFNGGKDCTVLLYLILYATYKWFSSSPHKLATIYIMEECNLMRLMNLLTK